MKNNELRSQKPEIRSGKGMEAGAPLCPCRLTQWPNGQAGLKGTCAGVGMGGGRENELRKDVEEIGEEPEEKGQEDYEDWEDAVEEDAGTVVVLGKDWFHGIGLLM